MILVRYLGTHDTSGDTRSVLVEARNKTQWTGLMATVIATAIVNPFRNGRLSRDRLLKRQAFWSQKQQVWHKTNLLVNRKSTRFGFNAKRVRETVTGRSKPFSRGPAMRCSVFRTSLSFSQVIFATSVFGEIPPNFLIALKRRLSIRIVSIVFSLVRPRRQVIQLIASQLPSVASNHSTPAQHAHAGRTLLTRGHA